MNLLRRVFVLAPVVFAMCASSAIGMNKELDAEIKRVDAPSKLQIGRTGRVTVTVTNEGYVDWSKLAPKLTSKIVEGPNGSVVNDQIAPSVDCRKAKHSGDTWTFQYDIEGPDTPGLYKLVWQMASSDGRHMFGRVSGPKEIQVYGVDMSANIERSAIRYTSNPVQAGKTFRFKVVVIDSGDVPFPTFAPELRSRVVSKPSGSTVTSLQQSFSTRNVRPDGKKWVFEETMQAPKTEGAYGITWQMYSGSSSFGNNQTCTLNVVK